MGVADLNNDGKVEIVTSSFEQDTVDVLEWKDTP